MKHFKIVLTDAFEVKKDSKILDLMPEGKTQYYLNGLGVVDIEFQHSSKPDGGNILFDFKGEEI